MLGNLNCNNAKCAQSERLIPFNLIETLDFCLSIFQIRQIIEQNSPNVLIRKDYSIDENQTISSICEIRLKQVLINILSNSYKFTASGEIVLHCLFSDDNPKKIRIKITDTGIGMCEKEKTNLFKPFKYKKDTKNAYGSGLGMYIIKEILDGFNIELHYESIQHQGSKFWFDLPIEDSESYLTRSNSVCENNNINMNNSTLNNQSNNDQKGTIKRLSQFAKNIKGK